ncbi:hypothetical protein [Nocardia africana]|nr:hypothetical protein [Nocardia africana]
MSTVTGVTVFTVTGQMASRSVSMASPRREDLLVVEIAQRR